CAIATGVRFIMSGANHALDGFSTYPFSIFGRGWEDPAQNWKKDGRGDTVVGNDVWIGMGATIMPGVYIGDGAIIGARAVVASDVPPYGVSVGNPAETVRRRFNGSTITRLLHVAWWDWPAEKITRNLAAIRGGDIDALERAT
ncbi:MAG: CatB-related O-acetyltransferase, partial [Amphiplicatus sp.]